mgnify:CR=1 FL=1
MINMSKNLEWNMVSSKEELYALLNQYRWILSDGVITYLELLINLDISAYAYNPLVSSEMRNFLLELDLYRKAVIYNIYHRTQNLLLKNNEGIDLEISNNENGMDHLYAVGKIDEQKFNVFSFQYSSTVVKKDGILFPKHSSNKVRNLYIGDSFLYLTKVNSDLREEELLSILEKYEAESQKTNPFGRGKGKIGGSSSNWNFEHYRTLKDLDDYYREVESHELLTSTDQRIIQAQEYFYQLLLADFQLKNSDFLEEGNCFLQEPKRMHKVFKKEYPGMKIKTDVQYW